MFMSQRERIEVEVMKFEDRLDKSDGGGASADFCNRGPCAVSSDLLREPWRDRGNMKIRNTFFRIEMNVAVSDTS